MATAYSAPGTVASPHVPAPSAPSAPAAPAALPGTAPTAAASAAPRRRISGIDVARALAIIGMLVAHLATAHNPTQPGWGWQWLWIFDGRSSATFATLAGVSIALMSRSAWLSGDPLLWRAARAKVAVRAALILPIGIGLQMLGTPIAVILPTYAVLFFMAIPLMRLRSWLLLTIAGVAVVLGSIVMLAIRQATTGSIDPSWYNFGFGIGEMIWGAYPALVWIAYVLVGIVVGRGDLGSPRYSALLIGIGLALALVGYGSGRALESALNADVLYWPDVLVSTEPHADSMFEVTGNIGVALAVLGICLLITAWRPVELALWPLASMGAMALTIYTAQIIVVAILGPDSIWFPTSDLPLVATIIGSILFASLWRATLGQGPLERLMKLASDAAARAASRPRPVGFGPPR